MEQFRPAVCVGLAVLASSTALAQDRSFSKEDRITPERLGLHKGNTRTSEPFVTRIYKTDAYGDLLKKQSPGYPFTITRDYTLKDNEAARVHEGVDLSSRPDKAQPPKPQDFKAGVYGVV